MPTSFLQTSTLRSSPRTLATRAIVAAMSAALLTLALPPVNAVAQVARATAPDGGVVLNFVNTELDAVVRALGQFTGKNFLVDPRVKGQLTLVSETPVNRDTAYRMLLGALRMQGFAVVEADGISKVVPEADAKLQGGAVTNTGRGDQLVTRVFKLNYESATNLVPVLRPMIAPNNPINAYPGNNTLVITDYADNLRRIADIIASVDTQSSVATDMIEIKNGIATDVAALVTRLMDPGASGEATNRVTAIADPRTNSVLIRASSPARTRLARDLIAKLDNPSSRATNMHVVYLRNAEAVKLAEVLRGVLTGQSGGSGGFGGSNSGNMLGGTSFGGSSANTTGGFGGTGNTSSALGGSALGGASSTGGVGSALGGTTGGFGGTGTGTGTGTTFSGGGATVQADATTNTLIITAPEPLYRSLREIVDMLDVRRAQIFVESLIVEVTASTAAEFGIQWLSGAGNLSSTSSGTGAFGGTAFGGAGTNLLGVAANPASLGNGLSIGITNGSVTIPGVGQVTNLGFLARALESKSGTNILSTPNLLTLDNEIASIIVGQNVPFITGSYAQTGTGGTTASPFQTIERKDVGLTLKVKPQVSEGGTVKMQIYQEVSSVDSATNTAGIITNKRAIESNVLVDDGQIIVIGGLVQDSVTGAVEKVPGLGDIPYIGGLFRYDSRRRAKTNLMVFLRPYVVREGTPNSNLLIDRYEYMRATQARVQPGEHWLLPDLKGPELPPRVPGEGDPLPRANSQGMVPTTIPRDMAAIMAEGPTTVLQIAATPTENDAQLTARRVADAGFNAYVEPGEGQVWYVRSRVARDMLTLDTTLSTLRQLGYSAEIVTRP
ncbi:type II secretion system secretin GspD [Pigmentiphaga litoralis]|uniref:General secretion pathway protein D n=1 Tax=Pigmentiphaga litoralis TaxID=516702 RepID=A0A7Y9IPU4_9BURK|nr:type II secretion system secretin GspD [Pigmentiphaga litoralis]NYE25648.1 general secretion pathway protein D [Pigmentiphaga litoralis]NYE80740.1 general secretion pathway protein D [Pigmentiphaga litoralis]